MSLAIAHDLARTTFETRVDGHVAALDYLRDGATVDITHVNVPPPIEGRGIASALTKAALDWARGEQLAVVPTCPYVRTWMRRKAEYQDLLAPGVRLDD